MVCLSILLTVSFAEHKLLILMKSSLLGISFMDGAFVVVSKRHHHIQCHLGFLIIYQEIVLHFEFRSMTHFNLYEVCVGSVPITMFAYGYQVVLAVC